MCFNAGFDNKNNRPSDFKIRFLDETVYKNLHMFLSKFYKKTIISRGPLSEPHGPPGVHGPQFGKRCSTGCHTLWANRPYPMSIRTSHTNKTNQPNHNYLKPSVTTMT